ncbi:MAG: molybdopterin-dependent oxidoreductase [Dehalococcoidia bacterium]|nr:molybdopterin-dependent oxidoreductase [Dehalococcoidia bacterium]
MVGDTGGGGRGRTAAVLAQWIMPVARSGRAVPAVEHRDWLIRNTPGRMATESIERLGENARPMLAWGAIAGFVVIGAIAGRWKPWLVGLVVLALSLVASVIAPVREGWGVIAVAALTGGVAAYLVNLFLRSFEPGGENAGEVAYSPARRTLLAGGIAVGFLAITGTAMIRNREEPAPPGDLRARELVDLSPDPDFPEVEGLSARVTPAEDHYVIDINLSPPSVDRDGWRLRVNGLVDTELDLAFADLRQMELQERVMLLQCISNEVGGPLIGNSTWTVVPLPDVLALAGMQEGARSVMARSADRYHETFRMDEVEDMYLALGQGRKELLDEHGSPARLLFPRHYGMRSVKWLTELRVAEDEPESYWHSRGWDRDAVMHLGSIIDAPTGVGRVTGPVTVAGTAFGHKGVEKVEVSHDDGESWHEAVLEAPLSGIAWQRWQIELDLEPGDYRLAVRAYDEDGVQTADGTEGHGLRHASADGDGGVAARDSANHAPAR